MAGIRLTKFGGLNPIETPENLGKQMAVLAENYDPSRHNLRPWRKPRKMSDKTGQFLYKEKCCEIVNANCDTSIVDTQINCGHIIATGIMPYPVMALPEDACAGNWTRLGFPCELEAPSAVCNTPISAVAVGNNKGQIRTYIYRLKNKFGQYSAGSYPSNLVELDAQSSVVVSLPTAFPPEYGITEIEVFASETNSDISGNHQDNEWFSVGSVPVGTSSFLDAYNELGEEIDSLDFESPPDNLRDIHYWRTGELIGLSDTLVCFSMRGNFHNWPEESRHELHDMPRAVLVGSAYGFVATDGRPAIITLSANCEAGSCHKINDSLTPDPHPIVSCRSAAIHNDHGIWATKDGLLMIMPNGGTRLLTADYYTQDQWRALKPETMVGAVHDGVYYGFTSEIGIRLRLPDSTYAKQDDAMLTTLKFSQGVPTALYRSFNDEFYLQFADGVYWWNEGTEFMTLKWHSATFDMPAITSFTAYKVMHNHADVTVRHWVDDELIDIELVQSNRPLRLPISNGLNWQVEIETQGEVNEYHIATSVRDLSEGVA
jgi:hypothetical protein